jgi:hypothetical protein
VIDEDDEIQRPAMSVFDIADRPRGAASSQSKARSSPMDDSQRPRSLKIVATKSNPPGKPPASPESPRQSGRRYTARPHGEKVPRDYTKDQDDPVSDSFVFNADAVEVYRHSASSMYTVELPYGLKIFLMYTFSANGIQECFNTVERIINCDVDPHIIVMKNYNFTINFSFKYRPLKFDPNKRPSILDDILILRRYVWQGQTLRMQMRFDDTIVGPSDTVLVTLYNNTLEKNHLYKYWHDTLEFEGVPVELRESLIAKFRTEIARAVRPRWHGRLERGGELATLTAPMFLKRVHGADISTDGTVHNETIRAIDPDLMKAVEVYISQRSKRGVGLGDAEGLTFVLSRPSSWNALHAIKRAILE